MKFIDLSRQQQRIRQGLEKRISQVLDHGQYIMGPEVEELETSLAEYVGTAYAISCASGTDALLMALMAYEVGPGDAVITSPFTFFATAEVISLLGATPIFVDIDPETFNLDSNQLKLAIDALNSADPSVYPLPRTSGSERLRMRGIIPVDLFGVPADYDPIGAIAAEHGLFVIQDAAQSFGSEYRGRKACALADIGCTSFFPAKPLGAYGDGGMCFTDSEDMAERMRSIRIHGQGTDKYENVRIGINGRLDTLQAAILLEKMQIFPEELDLREQAASRYTEGFQANPALQAPVVPGDRRSAWAQYSLLARSSDHRAELLERMKRASVPSAIYYPKPLHLQQAFAGLGYGRGDFPVSESHADRVFSIPMHPYLSADEQQFIVEVLAD